MKENFPSRALGDAVEAIGSLPGVGARSALRLALHLLRQPAENITRFADAVGRLATDVRYCRNCHMVCDEEECAICADPKRDVRTICVVESVRDVLSIEATGQYRGVYHVLGGIISPIDGIGPSELEIASLEARVKALGSCEVIFALSGDVEGETTAFYLYRRIAGEGVKVTTLARGLGFGDGLEYADTLTLGRSLEARQPFNP